MAENQSKTSQKERLKEITDSIEVGIKEMFESEKYRNYLQTMSRFHNYSLNNTILIAMQKPDATLVAGFNKWKDTFERNVKKGERGIKIIAPTPYKIKKEEQVLDPITKAPLLDEHGKVQTEEVEKQIAMFKPVFVFDVSQTEGKELPNLANDLTGTVEQYEMFMEALRRSSPVPIELKLITSGADGYYHSEDKKITIRDNMSELQTISTTVHEIAHAMLHGRDITKKDGEVKKSRNTEEVEAESISYAVCNYYGMETSDNSFGYIANWSQGKELKELKASLDIIGKTSSELITSIDKHFGEITKELEQEKLDIAPISKEEKLATVFVEFVTRYDPIKYQEAVGDHDSLIKEHTHDFELGNIKLIKNYLSEMEGEEAKELLKDINQYEISNYPAKLAYKVDEHYFSIHTSEEGYDYSFYDTEHHLMDGGVFDDMEFTIYEAIHEVLEIEHGFSIWENEAIEEVDFSELKEKTDLKELLEIEQLVLAKKAEEISDEVEMQMPDSNITVDEMYDYGYEAEEILPLGKERAIELFQGDVTIYALHPDGTEAMIFDLEELNNHVGYFGIEVAEWEQYSENRAVDERDDGLLVEDEKAFVELQEESNAIGQLNGEEIHTEQNYNRIDGIINNKPTVEELEQDAKNGKAISIMDLLDATRREQEKVPNNKQEKVTKQKKEER